MSDVVVTLPLSFGLDRWIDEGDGAGDPWTGQLWDFSTSGRPRIEPGERVYVVHAGKLRGYAPLVKIEYDGTRTHLVRGGEAVAVTIDEHIPGFWGYRYRWWQREIERPFPEWSNT